MFNVNTFKSNIEKHGYLPSNKFKVNVTMPPCLQGKLNVNGSTPIGLTEMQEMLTFRADAARTPACSLDLDSVARYGIGPRQAMPAGFKYDYTGLTFISDGHGYIWSFWYLWLKAIFGFAGDDNFNQGSSHNTLPSYQLEYKDQYATLINIVVYDQFGYETQKINLYDAFPTSLNENAFSWDRNGELLKITVGITFKEFTIDGVGLSKAKPVSKSQVIAPTTNNTVSVLY